MMNSVTGRMISSISRWTFCQTNSTCIVCKRLKSYKWDVIRAVRQIKSEDTQVYGPVIKQRNNSVIKDKKVKETTSDENLSKKKKKDKSDVQGSEAVKFAESDKNFHKTENKDSKDTESDLLKKVNSDIQKTSKSTKSNTKKSNDNGDTMSDFVGSEIHKDISESEKPHSKGRSPLSFILNYPLLKHSDNIDCTLLEQSTEQYVPSVTHIINKTQSDLQKFYLERWKRKMISEMGEEKFKEHQQETFRNGSLLHLNIQRYFSGEPEYALEIVGENVGYWKSISDVLKLCEKPVGIEEPVKHPYLCYRGQFDCVAVYKDTLCVIDWKTSKKMKAKLTDTFDNPIQVAAYIGAVNSSNLLQNKGFQIDPITSGAIVVAYPDGYPAHVHMMDQDCCEEYWKKWLERLHMYWSLRLQKEAPVVNS